MYPGYMQPRIPGLRIPWKGLPSTFLKRVIFKLHSALQEQGNKFSVSLKGIVLIRGPASVSSTRENICFEPLDLIGPNSRDRYS